MASIKNQIVNSLKQVNGIGTSKIDRKKEIGKTGFGNGTDRIHSVKTLQNYRSSAIQYGEWLKQQHGVKNIFDIGDKAVEYTNQYIHHLKANDYTNGYISTVESALKHLERGMNMFNKEVRGQSEAIKIFEERSISSTDKEIPQNRAFFSRDQAERVIANMSTSTKNAGHLCLNLGLRIKEAVNIRVEHIEDRGYSMRIDIKNGKSITKGGRFRSFQVPKHFEKQLRGMIQGKGLKDKIVPVKYETARKSFQRACEKVGEREDRGTHRFRHTYARERLNERVGRIERGKEVLDKMVDNKILGQRMNAGISRADRSTYEAVKSEINLVHSELGHGGNRWELVLTYMAD